MVFLVVLLVIIINATTSVGIDMVMVTGLCQAIFMIPIFLLILAFLLDVPGIIFWDKEPITMFRIMGPLMALIENLPLKRTGKLAYLAAEYFSAALIMSVWALLMEDNIPKKLEIVIYGFAIISAIIFFMMLYSYFSSDLEKGKLKPA